MTLVQSISDLFAIWPSVADFAKDIGVDYGTAKQMRRRGSIAPRHWLALASAAKRRGHRLSVETIAALHAARKAA